MRKTDNASRAQERARVYKREIRRLDFKKTRLPRGPEKEDALVEATATFLRTIHWEKDPDGVMRVKHRQ